jgi:cysteine desulfurase
MKLWPNSKPARIYADAAAATPLTASAKRELLRLLELFGNPSALHKEAVAAKRELETARERVAQTIAAHPDEIIFTAGGTEANNLAIFGTLRTLLREHGELNAITTNIEHASILEPLHALEEEGLYITVLSVGPDGRVDPKALREAISEETAFVSIQMINSEVGTIQDIHEIAKEIRHARKDRLLPLYFHTDASQAPLWLPLSVEKLGVDLMTLDGQKIGGPKGAGMLYSRRSVPLTPLIYGGGQEGGARSGTENLPLIGSFAVALKEAQEKTEAVAQKVAEARDFLLSEIKKVLPEIQVNGADGEWRAPNNINISIPHLNGDMAVVALDAEGVAASTRSACDTEDEAPSHVLAALGLTIEQAKNSIRLTLLPSATKSEARRIAKILAEVTTRYSQK